MNMAQIIHQLDQKLEDILRGWNYASVILLAILLVYVIYPLLSYKEPDAHPLLLCRQTNGSAVRQPGESAIYRSPEVPQGYPLRSGLDVRDPGASRWSSGRDGDLRDIWRKAITGVDSDDGKAGGEKGHFVAVHGSERPEITMLDDADQNLQVIGHFIQSRGAKRVAVVLPNSVELVLSVFAGSFYGFSVALLPHDQPSDIVVSLLQLLDADFLITSAGTIQLLELKQRCPKLKHTLYVVDGASRDIDWADERNGVSVWHELLALRPFSSPTEPEVEHELENPRSSTSTDIITVWINGLSSSAEIVKFSQGNIVAAVAAQVSAIPRKHRMSSCDLYLPTDHLSANYILVQTLAALYSNSSVALNSVASSTVELPLAAMKITPTVLSCSAETMIKFHSSAMSQVTSISRRLTMRRRQQALASGVMQTSVPLIGLGSSASSKDQRAARAPRLIYCFERGNAGTPPITSLELSDIRACTGARVVYALTAAKVAGTVAQTGFFDYRVQNDRQNKQSHFGVPPSSVELKMIDTEELKTTNEKAQGEIVVTGPAVFEGSVRLNLMGTIRDDGTLCYTG